MEQLLRQAAMEVPMLLATLAVVQLVFVLRLLLRSDAPRRFMRCGIGLACVFVLFGYAVYEYKCHFWCEEHLNPLNVPIRVDLLVLPAAGMLLGILFGTGGFIVVLPLFEKKTKA